MENENTKIVIEEPTDTGITHKHKNRFEGLCVGHIIMIILAILLVIGIVILVVSGNKNNDIALNSIKELLNNKSSSEISEMILGENRKTEAITDTTINNDINPEKILILITNGSDGKLKIIDKAIGNGRLNPESLLYIYGFKRRYDVLIASKYISSFKIDKLDRYVKDIAIIEDKVLTNNVPEKTFIDIVVKNEKFSINMDKEVNKYIGFSVPSDTGSVNTPTVGIDEDGVSLDDILNNEVDEQPSNDSNNTIVVEPQMETSETVTKETTENSKEDNKEFVNGLMDNMDGFGKDIIDGLFR